VFTREVVSIDQYELVARSSAPATSDPVFSLDPSALAARDEEYWRRHEAIWADIANPQQQETQQQ
jgi:hypothetical protein